MLKVDASSSLIYVAKWNADGILLQWTIIIGRHRVLGQAINREATKKKQEKNQKKGIFGHWGPKWLNTKKIFGDFRGRVSKSMLLLTERRQIYN